MKQAQGTSCQRQEVFFITRKVVLTADDVRRTLARIAHEIIEHNKSLDELVIVGLYTRGVPLARRISANVESFERFKVPTGSLDISHYRDDLALLERKPTVKSTDIPVNISNKSVVLVDDVLFTGRTVRAAMDAISWYGVHAFALADVCSSFELPAAISSLNDDGYTYLEAS